MLEKQFLNRKTPELKQLPEKKKQQPCESGLGKNIGKKIPHPKEKLNRQGKKKLITQRGKSILRYYSLIKLLVI